MVGKYVSLATAQGITWPLPEGTDEARLEAQLFPAKTPPSLFAEPDYSHQAHQNWSPGRFLNWATDIGPATNSGAATAQGSSSSGAWLPIMPGAVEPKPTIQS
ncbi:hypothetical protein MDG893_19794 [Marinobacter algicola DG893]|uniref:Uncharacterized protein n=1 Tax=Marinobacter algicola DG893 TaxID=443152 RepID=A6F0R3_9GAMM|nr:hypothetical protein MDG893_19794 [Marinobacter algicola DG893]